VKRCWAEDQAERPDFHALKTIIKRINKYGRPDIIIIIVIVIISLPITQLSVAVPTS